MSVLCVYASILVSERAMQCVRVCLCVCVHLCVRMGEPDLVGRWWYAC